MKTMRVAAVLGAGLILCAGLVSIAQAQDKPKDLIVGKWESGGADKGVIEFTKDGKLKITVRETSADGTYKFIDEKMEKMIEVTVSLGGQTLTEKLTIAVTKDELTTTDSKNMTEKFKRAK